MRHKNVYLLFAFLSFVLRLRRAGICHANTAAAAAVARQVTLQDAC